MENASSAFLDAVRKYMRQIRSIVGATTINPDLLTAAERIQYEGYLRREETNSSILALSKNGVPIKQIVRRTGHSRKLVSQIIRGERTDVLRVTESSLKAYLPWPGGQWESGARNASALWRTLRTQGFRSCLGVMAECTARRRRAEKTDAASLVRVPSARNIARLIDRWSGSSIKI